MSESDSHSDSELKTIKSWNKIYHRCARINFIDKSSLASTLSETLYKIHFIFKRQYVVDKYVMGIISIVIRISRNLEILLMNGNHRLKKEEALKIEAIVGLSNKLETLVKTLIKSRELEFEGREKILKIVKPLLWLTRFTDSKLHVDLMDYEKRKKRVFGKRRTRFKRPKRTTYIVFRT